MTHGGTYAEQRYVNLEQIGANNTGGLGLAWSHDFDSNRGEEATPLVIDGVMYTTSAWSNVVALDAATGAVKWRYDPQVSMDRDHAACCDVVNRGFAAWGGMIFVGALDGRMLVFKLGGTGKRPPYDAPAFVPANLPSDSFTPQQTADGGNIFKGNCGICHGAGARSRRYALMLVNRQNSSPLPKVRRWPKRQQLRNSGAFSFGGLHLPDHMDRAVQIDAALAAGNVVAAVSLSRGALAAGDADAFTRNLVAWADIEAGKPVAGESLVRRGMVLALDYAVAWLESGFCAASGQFPATDGGQLSPRSGARSDIGSGLCRVGGDRFEAVRGRRWRRDARGIADLARC